MVSPPIFSRPLFGVYLLVRNRKTLSLINSQMIRHDISNRLPTIRPDNKLFEQIFHFSSPKNGSNAFSQNFLIGKLFPGHCFLWQFWRRRRCKGLRCPLRCFLDVISSLITCVISNNIIEFKRKSGLADVQALR